MTGYGCVTHRNILDLTRHIWVLYTNIVQRLLLQLFSCSEYTVRPSRVSIIRISRYSILNRIKRTIIFGLASFFIATTIKWLVKEIYAGDDVTLPVVKPLRNYFSGSRKINIKRIHCLWTSIRTTVIIISPQYTFRCNNYT